MNEESLFLAALERPSGAERQAFLDHECAGDPALHARLAVLLAAHDRTHGILERPSALAPRDANPLAAGAVLAGRFTLTDRLGEGGMGEVWVAQQTTPVQRRVALKVIRTALGSPGLVARFEQERQALALMDHPNVARVLEAGEDDGRPFFVMELIDGVPVTRFCDEAKLTLRQRLELFVGVCAAVQHAHTKGIIHRDLKPSNVLVTTCDGKPVAKVIDFGVAKAIGGRLGEQSAHAFTEVGAFVGTPEYVSPEQADANNPDVDTLSDVYSLGVLLYELLTGTTPFSRKDAAPAGVPELLRAIREQEPPTPSARLTTTEDLPDLAGRRGTEPAALRRLVKGELDWIVMKALEKERQRRYESPNAFAMDVLRHLNGEPVLACPPSAGYRLRKFVGRNKGRLAVAAGLMLAMTVAAASVGWALRDRAARRAEGEQAEAARLATVEGKVRDSLATTRTLIGENKLTAAREWLAQARAQLGDDEKALSGLTEEVEALTAALDRHRRFFDLIDRAHQAETASPLASGSVVEGASDKAAIQVAARVRERRPALAVPHLLEALGCYGILEHANWTRTLEGDLLGKQQVEQVRRAAYEELLWLADDVVRRQREHRTGRELSREESARVALDYLSKAGSVLEPTRAFFAIRTRCHKALGDEAAQRADATRAERTSATLALDHALRGLAAFDANQLDEGVQAFEAALRLEPTHYWSMMWLGYCLCDLGKKPEDFAGAARVFSGCILKRPDHAHAYFCRGNANSNLGRNEEAVADYTRAIDLDPEYGEAWTNRGKRRTILNQLDKAASDFDTALRLNPKDARAWLDRGIVRHLQARLANAIEDYTRSIDLDPGIALTWSNRSSAYAGLGKPREALKDASKAVELDPKLSVGWNNRGYARSKLNRLDKAIDDYDQAIKLDSTCALPWKNRGDAHSRLNQLEKAIDDYTQATKIAPSYAMAWKNRGLAYFRLGKPGKTVEDCTKAIRCNPNYFDAYLDRGAAYTRLGQEKNALRDFSEVIKLKPEYALGWLNRGVLCAELGRYEEAIPDLGKAIERGADDPRVTQAFLLRGFAHSRLARYAEAQNDYQAFLKRAPNQPGAFNALAWLLATCPDPKVRDPKRAVELASKAVKLAPKDANCRRTLGLAQYRAGNWQAAVDALEKARALDKTRTALDQFYLAMAHRQLGNRDEAKKAYERAIDWLKKNEEATAKVKWLAEELRLLRKEAETVLGLDGGTFYTFTSQPGPTPRR